MSGWWFDDNDPNDVDEKMKENSTLFPPPQCFPLRVLSGLRMSVIFWYFFVIYHYIVSFFCTKIKTGERGVDEKLKLNLGSRGIFIHSLIMPIRGWYFLVRLFFIIRLITFLSLSKLHSLISLHSVVPIRPVELIPIWPWIGPTAAAATKLCISIMYQKNSLVNKLVNCGFN